MIRADQGSRGPWYPSQEFRLDYHTRLNILDNFNISLDLMASHSNALVERYFSQAYEPEAAGWNLFQQPIGREEFSYIFPPPQLYWYTVKHLEKWKARGIGVVPMWKGLPWYSLLVSRNHLPAFVKYFKLEKLRYVRDDLARTAIGGSSWTLMYEFDFNIVQPLETCFSMKNCILHGCNYCV